MYDVEWGPGVPEQTLALTYEAALDLGETIAGIMQDPWNFRRASDEPAGSHYAHRAVPFANGLAVLTFLILEHAAEVHITGITWLG